MDNYQNIIIFIIAAFLIAVSVHYLFRKQERFGTLPLESRRIPPKRSHKIDYSDRVMNFHDDSDTDVDQVTPECVLSQNEQDTVDYMQKHLLGTREICDLKPQSAKKFHKDFFGFRDKTQMNSSMRYDPVDFITDLYLDGNTEVARRYPNMQIKDLFDEATKGPNLYTRECVRLPKFDNINPEGWTYQHGNPGMHNVRDEWAYSNEKVMNGGKIMGNITGHDNMTRLDMKHVQ